MCSIIDSGEKGYKLPEQILFNLIVFKCIIQCQVLATTLEKEIQA